MSEAIYTLLAVSISGLIISDGLLHISMLIGFEWLSNILANTTMIFGVNYSPFGTPVLVHASQKGYTSVVKTLLRRGADLYKLTNVNKIGALDVASDKCYDRKPTMEILMVEKHRLSKLKDAMDAKERAAR